jgi:NHL repeat
MIGVSITRAVSRDDYRRAAGQIGLAALILATTVASADVALADVVPRSAVIPNSAPRSIDGPATAVRFATPWGLAFDSKGNLYVADRTDKVIRRITPAGEATTFAGSPGKQGHGDGVGADARFASPFGIAIDKRDVLYVTDSYNETIRKITPTGVVSTFAGVDGRAGIADGVGTAARFDFPQGIAIDYADNLYVVAESAIRKISPGGQVTTLAGHDKPGSPSQIKSFRDGTGAEARFNDPVGVTIDSQGDLFVTDNANYVIRKITPSGQVSTLAGMAGQRGETDGQGASARFYSLGAITIDSQGNLYVADGHNAVLLRKISPIGMVATIFRAADPPRSNGSPAHLGTPPRVNALTTRLPDALYLSVGGREPGEHWDGAILTLSPEGQIATFAGPAADSILTSGEMSAQR